ncbi:MAG: DUF4190 domain-containing protein [Candidatus Saccharimonas sp.]|nr:DUF4190 domain-containing protein [Planctomycetaceae bacterium]
MNDGSIEQKRDFMSLPKKYTGLPGLEPLAISSKSTEDDDPLMRFLLPVGRSGWAIAAGYLGLFSVLCLPAPFALLAGILAVREIRANPNKTGMGRAVFGIVMGALGTLLLALTLVVVGYQAVFGVASF